MLFSDFDEDDFDEPDPDFGLSAKDMDKKKAAAHAVSFKVLEPSDIRRQQDDMMNDVNLILDLTKRMQPSCYATFDGTKKGY